MPERQIAAMGGTPDDVLLEHVLGLASGRRVLFVPTAGGENAPTILSWYERMRGRGSLTHLSFFPWPPAGLHDLALTHDVILVSGGNTANALAIWRLHGFDAVLREALEHGILLAGWSAGMICWFEHGVTDSFGPELAPMECLGFLSGSACPHYDGEARRRPVYTELVAGGLPPGVAADDDVALHYVGGELREAVTSREGASAYRVGVDGERPLATRLLTPR
ncbi:MAG TPA: peptidase E [Gaiellaceae bacterium]